MIGALVYSAIPPVVLGRMKLPLAEALHEKTLKADADMNKADWMTALAGVVGILGVGAGIWWADSAAALFISIGVVKDGVLNIKGVFSDLMDQPPTTVERERDAGLIEGAVDALEALTWVQDADVRLRDEGAVVAGEAFVVPTGDSVTLEQLRDAARAVHAVDWKVYDVVVTAVESVDRARDPQEGEPVR
jgi:divalent metal cation (Fe/Co/Zn/Cd) transporter